MSAARDGDDDEPPIEEHPSEAKLARRVAAQIEAEIAESGWPVGSSLGSEIELRQRFGVSRALLREAARLLEHHDVARMRRGPNGGLIVRAPDAGSASRAMVVYLQYAGTSIDDLMQARMLLEPTAAGLAAQHIDEAGVAKLRDAFAAEYPAGRAWQRADVSHRRWDHEPLNLLLSELSGNPVLNLFVDVVTRLGNRYAYSTPRLDLALLQLAAERSHAQRHDLIEAVVRGDAVGAHSEMTEYLRGVWMWMQENKPRPRSARALEPGTGASVTEQTAARIQDDIVRAGWPVGSALGTEAQLLQRYGVGREALREAIRLLEHHSLVQTRRGRGGGLIVTRPNPQASIDAITVNLRYRRVLDADMVAVREPIDVYVVSRLATRHGEPGLAEELERIIARDDSRPMTFHSDLAVLAGNSVLSLFARIIVQTQSVSSHPAPTCERASSDHRQIIAAILTGDVGLAAHRARRHLHGAGARW